jgi:integrase
MTDDNVLKIKKSELIGSVVRIFQRGRIWYANFQVDGRQRRLSLATTNKKEARRRAVQLEAEIAEGRWQPPCAPVSLTEAMDAYLDSLRGQDRAPTTVRKYVQILKRLVEWATGEGITRLAQLDLKSIDRYRSMRALEGAKAKTKYVELVLIRQLVNFALSRDMVAVDPLKGFRVAKPKPTTQPCWTYEQLTQILAASPSYALAALTLLAESGMRFGELQSLTWDDIDLEANAIRIQSKPGWKPKSGDQRAIPISSAARQILESLPTRYRWVVTMPGSKRHPEGGRQWSERRLLGTLKRGLKQLGLPGKLHTFRHTFISNALLQQVPVSVVREWVGHVSPEILDLYTHVHSKASQAAMQRLGLANQSILQKGEDSNDHDSDSAQIQHTEAPAQTDSGAR